MIALGEKEAEQLDQLLWLSSYELTDLSPKARNELRTQTSLFGKACAASYPVTLPSLYSFLENSGIQECKEFPDGMTNMQQVHAYYWEDRKEIQYDPRFCEVVYPKASFYFGWTREMITGSLIIHELFHHLECTRVGTTTEWLKQTFGIKHPKPIWREIAAFSFVNTQIPHMICQMLDLLWLEQKNPTQFNKMQPILGSISSFLEEVPITSHSVTSY